MAAALHEVEIIELLVVREVLRKGLDNGLFIVVDENDDVGQFERCAVADPKTRGNALDDRAFGGADKGGRTLGIIVCFEVESDDKAVAGLSVNGAAGENEALALVFEDALLNIFVHSLADGGNALRFAGLFEIDLGEHQAEGGRRVADDLLALVPVIGLGGVLIARDASPFGEVDALRGHHKLRHGNADIVLKLRVH